MDSKTIEQAKKFIQEYADNPNDMDLTETAKAVLDLAYWENNHYCEPSWQHRQNILGTGD